MSGVLKVQGIVAARDGSPQVQFMQVEHGRVVSSWQQTPDEATEHARLVVESAANAVYEAAFIAFLRQEMKLGDREAFEMLRVFRIWRADKWGQPAPEDWRGA
jgi:hypothetical protein